IVVGRLVHAVSVHVAADDVHLVRPHGPNLRAIHLLAFAVDRLLSIQLADFRIGLCHEVAVDGGTTAAAKDLAAAWTGSLEGPGVCRRRCRLSCRRRTRRRVLVSQALDTRASVRSQLRFYPVDGVAIAFRALPPVAELAQGLNRRLVA